MAALAAVAGPGIARAEETDDSRDYDRFGFTVGGFFVDLDSETEVGSQSGRGTTINLEDDLGMDSSETVLFLGAEWRFAARHSIGLSYLNLDRDSFTTIDEEFEFDGEIFPINADVDAKFDYDVLGAIYRYSMIQREKTDFRFLFGVSYIDFDIAMEAETIVGNIPILIRGREEEEFPVPSVGLGLRYRLAPDWYLRSSVAYFEYSQDDWEGTLLISSVDFEYFPWRRFGFGLGYSRVDIDYDEEGSDPFDVDFTYESLLFRLIGSFR